MSGLGTQAARGIEASKDAARQVFVYCNFRTNQTLYSLNERVLRVRIPMPIQFPSILTTFSSTLT